jgi:hypothetical protein
VKRVLWGLKWDFEARLLSFKAHWEDNKFWNFKKDRWTRLYLDLSRLEKGDFRIHKEGLPPSIYMVFENLTNLNEFSIIKC